MERHTTQWNDTLADVSAREHSTNRSGERTLRLTLTRLEQLSVEVRAAAKAIGERYEGSITT